MAPEHAARGFDSSPTNALPDRHEALATATANRNESVLATSVQDRAQSLTSPQAASSQVSRW